MKTTISFILLTLTSSYLETTSAKNCNFLSISGGLVPQASEVGGDYYEKYELDYGREDKVRQAGSLRGFIPPEKIANLNEKDPFLKWWNKYLDKGPNEELSGRIKPIYAADFGKKSDLKKGENPKIVILRRRLISDNGKFTELPASLNMDVEVREIKSPWLKARCNFAVRYIVPNRINILKLMEAKGKFVAEVKVLEDEKRGKQVCTTLKVRPSLLQRLLGKRDFVISRRLPAELLENSKAGAAIVSSGDILNKVKSLLPFK